MGEFTVIRTPAFDLVAAELAVDFLAKEKRIEEITGRVGTFA
jgi:hypothetical protein